MKFISTVSIITILQIISTTNAQAVACPTDPSRCTLPNCLCSSTTIPGGISSGDVPQIVMLSFDSAVNVQNFSLYQELLDGRTNPNSAPISATFFVSHEYNDYNLTHQLYRQGHEIAVNSITRFSSTDYWRNLNESMWIAEIVDQKSQMAHLANISIDDWEPVLYNVPGKGLIVADSRNESPLFTNRRECSRPTLNIRQPGILPYTNDFASVQDCQISPCPRESYPGFWTMPMIDLLGGDGFPCPLLDNCNPRPTTAADTLNLLRANFLDQYTTNRAPYGVFATSGWLIGAGDEYDARREGYKMFLDYLAGIPDVYVVSISKALEWVKNPTPTSAIHNFLPWQPTEIRQNFCSLAKSCRNEFQGSERYMVACSSLCPANYPWLHNPLGEPITAI